MGNLWSFIIGLHNHNELINKIERLHLYSGVHLTEPSYHDLLHDWCNPWDLIEGPPPPAKCSNGASDFSAMDECRITNGAGNILLRMLKQYKVFPRLCTVSLGDMPNITWGMPRGPFYHALMENSAKKNGLESIPRLLIDVATVQHVCQSTRLGPYAFDFAVYKPSTPVAVFSYHPTISSPRCPCTVEMGPMIWGATNRYYYTSLFVVENGPTGEWDPVEEAQRIHTLVHCISSVQAKNLSSAEVPRYLLDLDGTKLEIYDYIRYVDPVPGNRAEDNTAIARASRPATSLMRIQSLLDEALPKWWKGRVLLKNREEAPPCTACGLDIEEQWEDIIADDDSLPGVLFNCESIHGRD